MVLRLSVKSNAKMERWRGKLGPALPLVRYLRHRWLPRTTYAADFEDLAAELLLGNIGRFIDVGANDGTSLSNTALFALQGARGLCFEPNPADYLRLREFFRFAKHVECVGEGLSDHSGMLDLRSDNLLSTITATEDAGLAKILANFYSKDAALIPVQVERLSTWLDRRPDFQCCDLLSVDVEGHELNVLRGIEWERHRKPARCLIVETHARGGGEPWLHRDYEAISELLAQQSYVKIAASINNTFWLHRGDCQESRIREAKNRLPSYEWFDLERTVSA
jgi:FkbM family methyltransferase